MEDRFAGLSDDELAARVDQADADALNALCRRHYASVFRFAYRLTQNRAEAEDCTQEAFTRFIRSWERWRVRDRGAGPWLSTIVKHVVADHWARALRRPPGDPPVVDLADPAATGAEAELLERERAQAVGAALARLGEACQALIGLLFAKRLTLRQAAEELRESHEAIKKRYQRCVQRLQAALDPRSVA